MSEQPKGGCHETDSDDKVVADDAEIDDEA